MKPNAQTERRHVCVHLTKRPCTRIIREKTCAIIRVKCKKVGLYAIRKLCCHQRCARYYLEDSILSSKNQIVSYVVSCSILFCVRYLSKILFEDLFILHNEAAFYTDLVIT